MKFLQKIVQGKGLKMTVALLCLLGVATYTISGAVSTPSTQKKSYLSDGDDAELTLPPELTIDDADFEGRAPLNITFDSNQFVGPMQSYSWNFGDGETHKGPVASHTFISAGTYSVTLTAKQESGEIYQKKISVLVQP